MKIKLFTSFLINAKVLADGEEFVKVETNNVVKG